MSALLYIAVIGLILYLAYSWFGPGTAKKKSTNKNIPEVKRRRGYGKWIGGGLGWAFGGPIGGILGFMFGSMVDGMQSGAYEYTGTRSGDFGVSLLVLAAAVMRADGKVVKSELEYVRRFLKMQFGEEEGQNKVLMLKEILQQDYNVQEVAQQIRQFMEYPSRLQLLHFLFGLSLADGSYHAREIDMIEAIATYLGIKPADFKSIKAMFIKDVDSAYKILEISRNASDEEVKKAYHRMAIKYHPDKVAHLGEEVRSAATEKFQKLNAAYEEIKKQRGIK
jgi:DnaJ like chaperone protein